ncbi:hypothetical protein KEM55_007667, partial [Ascosphaera atra]
TTFKRNAQGSRMSSFGASKLRNETAAAHELADIGIPAEAKYAVQEPTNDTELQEGSSQRLEDVHYPGSHHSSDTDKTDAALDYYISGPGRRVGYSDLTSIDWIFEHTKERQRLRKLYTSFTGPLGPSGSSVIHSGSRNAEGTWYLQNLKTPLGSQPHAPGSNSDTTLPTPQQTQPTEQQQRQRAWQSRTTQQEQTKPQEQTERKQAQTEPPEQEPEGPEVRMEAPKQQPRKL